MADSTFCDCSEFQANVDADAYIAAGHRVIIARSHNGFRADHMMPARRDYLRGKPFTAVGYYQYLTKDRDAATQAHEFIATIGTLHANEFPILDLEEGSGSQIARANAWFAVVDAWAGFDASLYTGKSMLDNQLGGAGHWGKRPLWIASYPSSYTPDPSLQPAGADWWQYSDRGHFPGLAGGVDASVFRGTPEQFAATVRPGAPKPAPAPSAGQTRATVLKANGAIETFELLPSGEVLHKWQTAAGNGWVQHWQSLGIPR